MNAVYPIFAPIAAYYVSFLLPAEYEKRCSSYVRAQFPCPNELQRVRNQELISRASCWIKHPIQVGAMVRTIGLAINVASTFLIAPPPLAIGLAVFKITEVILFQLVDADCLNAESHKCVYHAARILRLMNRVLSVTVISAHLFVHLPHQHFAVLLAGATFIAFEGVAALASVIFVHAFSYTQKDAWQAEFYGPDPVLMLGGCPR